ncbi:hypothetical protein DEAC_c24740 [Desulfosporosinus acididurans]|uniref:Uncharacterized protein n=1 Tax=Desulfosporosinus acididurans TaxID=476652 RepID=A0A0J1FQR0_9FIRM|nr:hypothetical protein [Desulfosporosinus acididurans]KLU65844.1 hypothetical protein DEAC_c24740 [Desulfosporosinus acididurans]
MTFITSFSKMLSYIAKSDPLSYYLSYSMEENENQAESKNESLE